MTKVIIQIPCFNEEVAIAVTLAAMPRSLPGFDTVEWLIVDDGSNDRTAEVARRLGVHHIIALSQHKGLAAAFMAGVDACLRLQADVIVNADADNQYCADDIASLVAPILSGRADFVIGARPIQHMAHFSPVKKLLQYLGSAIVRWASETAVADAASGFRALSRDAAMRLNIFSNYSYALESLIQAGNSGIRVLSVPIRVNQPLRPSRLVKSIPSYLFSSAVTILRVGMIYKPLRFLAFLGVWPFGLGFGIGMRWAWLGAREPQPHLALLIASAGLILLGVQLWILGLAAHLISINRRIIEELQFSVRAARYRREEPRS